EAARRQDERPALSGNNDGAGGIALRNVTWARLSAVQPRRAAMIFRIRRLHPQGICNHHDDVEHILRSASTGCPAQEDRLVLRAELVLELQIPFIIENILRPELIQYPVYF